MKPDCRRRRVSLPGRGVDLALLDFGGDGPPALLSHANGFCAALWAPVAEALRSQYRVLAFDARGHGDSSVPQGPEAYHWDAFVGDLEALLDALEPELGGPVYGIGHSFGGTVTLRTAALRPDRFERIAMVDPVLVPPPDLLPRELREGPPAPMADIARKRRNVWPSREAARDSWVGRLPFARWDERAFGLYLAEALRDRADGQVELKCHGDVEAAVYEMSDSLDLIGSAEGLACPGLLLFALQGNFSRTFSDRLAALARDLRVAEVDAGHLLPMEVPDTIAEALLTFGEPGASRPASSRR